MGVDDDKAAVAPTLPLDGTHERVEASGPVASPPAMAQLPPPPEVEPFRGPIGTMVGSAFGPWRVLEALHDEPDLWRFGVAHPDGRYAMADLARGGTPRAAAMMERAVAQRAAMGVHANQHPYVVYGHYTPNVPPPPPATTPARRGRGWLWLLAIPVVALIGIVVYLAIPKTPDRPLVMATSGSWGESCKSPYALEVRLDQPGIVEVLGKRRTTTRDHEKVVFELSRRELAGIDEVVVRGGRGDDLEDSPQRATVSTRARHPDLENPRSRTGAGVTLSRVDLTIDRKPTDVSPMYGTQDDLAPAEAAVVFVSCGLRARKAEQGIARVDASTDRTTITFDVARYAWETAGDKPLDKIVVPVTLDRDDGGSIHIEIVARASLSGSTKNPFLERVANVATQPLLEAPDVEAVSRPRPIAVLWDGELQREHLQSMAPVQAPYVAIVTTEWSSSGSCGPYQSFGHGNTYATRKVWKAAAKLYEAKTGKLVGQKAFRGSYPECPYTIMVSAYGAASVEGSSDTAAVKAWLATFQK